MARQIDLFGARPGLPPGFKYEPALLSPAEELVLLEHVRALPFKAFQFHAYEGKRRVVSFGWRYDFNDGQQHEGRASQHERIIGPTPKQHAAHGATGCQQARGPLPV